MVSKRKNKKSKLPWLIRHKKTSKVLIWTRNILRGNRDYKYFGLISIISVVLVIGLWIWNWKALNDYGNEIRGTHGDMFGAVNAIFSGLAFAGIIISLYLQRIDLKNQFDEIKKTNKEFATQNKTSAIQLFENQYYKMIDLHKDNVREMKITFFDHIRVPYQSRQGNGFNNQEILRDVTGRKIFVGMMHEFHALFTIISFIAEKVKLTLEPKNICSLAYQIFFYGRLSIRIKYDDLPINFQEELKKALGEYQNSFYKRHTEDMSKSKSDSNYYFKFFPFEGHESRLAHYYRHLFQIVKFVVQQEKKGLIEYEQTRQYLRVLRAQLSNAEQLMLYYNYVYGFGINWDYRGTKGYQFFTKYRMIHNIPIDRVIGPEKPREHFKDYIEKHCTEEDTLFEWGDYPA